MTNEELAINIQLGHTEHYAELWANCKKLLYRLFRQSVKSLPLPNYISTEDLQQEMYFALCRAAEAYDDTKPWAFTTYLRFSVRNVLRDALPIQQFSESSYNQTTSDADGNETEYIELMEDAHAVAAFVTLEITDIQLIVRQELAKLPHREQNVVVLHALYSMSYPQIADKYGTCPEQIRKRYQRGLQILRQSKPLRRLYHDEQEHRSGTKDGSRATPDLARLVGTRFVLVNEPQKGKCLDEGLIKQLTGSDNITCRPLYGDPIEYKPRFKIYITTNNLPAVADDTIFASDRIRILPFNRHFSKDERDTSLKSKLREGNGKSALLNWLIEGYRIYRENGLHDTAEAAAVLRQYRRDNDYIQEFIDDCLELQDPQRIHGTPERLTNIQSEYNDWCRNSNLKPLGKRNFEEELQKHGVTITQYHHQKCAYVTISFNHVAT